jgi:hypothetical protein
MATLAGCEFGKITLPVRDAPLVVHAVLSTTAPSYQAILVERALTGQEAVSVYHPPDGGIIFHHGIDSREPILSDFGVPESFALVEVTLPDGQVVVAPEGPDAPGDKHGEGVYKLPITGAQLVRGGTYRLRIRTTRGEELTAQTTVPQVAGVTISPIGVFDRSRDTLALGWSAVGGAAGYEVRVGNPYGPWSAHTDGLSVRVTGALRNLGTDNLGNVFIPAFRQTVTVSALDANLYAYFRTANDGYTGSGLASSITGGYGVFGSYVPLYQRSLDVTAQPKYEIEGTWELIANANGDKYGGMLDAQRMKLYVESPSQKSGQGDAITVSASHTFVAATPSIAVGTHKGDSLRLTFINGQTVADTVDLFKGAIRNDTLRGVFRRGAQATYVLRRP